MSSFKTLYEDDDVFVIEKPAGLLVHATGAKREEHTLIDELLEVYPALAGIGDDPSRPGLVHRLDRDVSGVMVIAKTQDAFQYLKDLFTNRSLYKEYLALVYGRMSKDEGEINFKIARSKARGRMVARSGEQDGKEAKTEYEVLSRYKTATYLKVVIHTGRTHQIRAHMKAIDHPIVGDKLYANAKMRNIRPIPMDRLFLHAHTLRLVLPSGQEKSFTAPLPEELTKILEALPAASL